MTVEYVKLRTVQHLHRQGWFMISEVCSAFFLSFTEYDCEKRETSQNNDSCSQTHHRVTTTQTYPTETRTERDNLLNTMMLMHLDIDLLGLSKGGDGKRTNKNNKKIAN